LDEDAEIHALGKELSQQAIGVLVGAAFPTVIRFGKIAPHIQFILQFLKAREFLAVIPRVSRMEKADQD
jgi:hypothetical protein